MIEGAIEPQTDVPIIPERLAKIRPLRATRGGFVHHLRKVGDRVAQGDPLAAILDLFGDEVERITSPVDGYIVTYPHMLGNQAAATGEVVAFVAPPK